MALPSELLASIKQELDITWSDINTDTKLTGIISRGISDINKKMGETIDYTIEDKAKELLIEYCRYSRSGALDEFYVNYLSEILGLQMQYDAKRYMKKWKLYSLALTGETLIPAFSPDIYDYSFETYRETGIIEAVPVDFEADIVITLNSKTLISKGSSILWVPGRNIVEIKIAKDALELIYKITVIKS